VTTLLDSSVLIALTFPDHDHHSAARSWFSKLGEPFATCPITQGSLLRYLLRQGSTLDAARGLLSDITDIQDHVLWPDTIGYRDVRLEGIIGHRQVTDAYLAHLARVNQGRLATFDDGLAALHSDVAELVPVRG
jgi:uncharacterized protein